MEIFVQFVEALVWPITVIVIAFSFRPDLRAMLERLSHLKFHDLEASFEKRLRSAQDEIEKLPPTQITPSTGAVTATGARPVISSTAISPRATILESWMEIERAITSLAERLPITEPGRRTPYKLMRELKRLGLVTSEAVAAYDELRTLRNEAAHAPSFAVTSEDASRYAALATDLAGYLEQVDAAK